MQPCTFAEHPGFSKVYAKMSDSKMQPLLCNIRTSNNNTSTCNDGMSGIFTKEGVQKHGSFFFPEKGWSSEVLCAGLRHLIDYDCREIVVREGRNRSTQWTTYRGHSDLSGFYAGFFCRKHGKNHSGKTWTTSY